MTNQTLSGTYTNGITLNATNTTIAATSVIKNGHGTGITGGSPTAWTLINNGNVSGSVYYGAYFASGGIVTNTSSGTITGPIALSITGAAGTVSNAGSIGGSGTNSAGIILGAGGLVSNTASGIITGSGDAIAVAAAPGTVANSGRVTGGVTGIYFLAGGSVTNAQGASISGDNDGVLAHSGNGVLARAGSGTVTNAGSIAANTYGVRLGGGGFVSNTGPGAITGGQGGVLIAGGTGNVINSGGIHGGTRYGVLLGSGGTVTNAGTISGAAGAVSFGGTAASRLIVDPGAVFIGQVNATATAANTIELAAGTGSIAGIGSSFTGFGTIAIDAGATWTVSGALLNETITGFAQGDTLDLTGIVANSYSFSGGVLSLFNTGSSVGTIRVSGSFASNDFVLGPDGGGGTDIAVLSPTTVTTGLILTNLSTTIGSRSVVTNAPSRYAVFGGPGTAWTLTNAGSITSGSQGVWLRSDGAISNTASGTISGRYGIYFSDTPGTVLNAGHITGTYAIKFSDGGLVTNAATGSISATSNGVLVNGSAGTVSNSGNIVGGTTGAADGVRLNAGGLISNTASGTISGAVGAYVQGAAGTVSNAGQISGADGIALLGGGSVTNAASGLVSGTQDGVAIALVAGTVSNAGIISGARFGIGMLGGGSVVNFASGTITGSSQGIAMAGTGTNSITNSGSIISPGFAVNASSAIVSNTASGLLSGSIGVLLTNGAVTNAGRIFGTFAGVAFASGGTVTNSGTIAGGYGVQGAGTVVNSGAIIGSDGYAVTMLTSHNRLVVDAGAVFSGNVEVPGTANVLELAAGNGTIAGIGTSFSGFGTIAIDTGETWTIAGALLNETITGFSAIDSLDLTNVAANSASLAGTALKLYQNGAPVGSITLDSGVSGEMFNATSDGQGGTRIGIAQAIPGMVTTGVTLTSPLTSLASTSYLTNTATNGSAVFGPSGANWTLVNAGRIVGTDFGVTLASGGSVTNTASGLIAGAGFGNAIRIQGAPATVDNAGTITSDDTAIYLAQAGSVISAAAATTCCKSPPAPSSSATSPPQASTTNSN